MNGRWCGRWWEEPCSLCTAVVCLDKRPTEPVICRHCTVVDAAEVIAGLLAEVETWRERAIGAEGRAAALEGHVRELQAMVHRAHADTEPPRAA